MPQLEYFVVCESVSIDRDTNRISLFNIIEDLRPVSTKMGDAPVVQITAVACWNRQAGDEERDFQSVLRLRAPGDEPKEFPLNFRMERPRHRLTFRLLGIPSLRPGELIFELLLNGRHEAQHAVTIHPIDGEGYADEVASE